MPGSTACPISEVDRALASYIHSREETLKIRQILSSYLTSSLRPVSSSTQTEHLNHECPQHLSAVNTHPPGLKNSRLAYLQALRARSQAQAKHHNLQNKLEELRNHHMDENPTQPDSDYDNEVLREHVALLRQRRQFAELQVIQEYLDKLLSARPSDAPLDPKDLVRDTIGDQPNLPAEKLEQLDHTEEDQTWIFKLKQEVLGAKSSMENAQAARSKAQTASRELSSLRRQVQALERARDDMVEWMQSELAKMEEDSIFLEDASPVKRPTQDTAPLDAQSAEKRIQESYNRYTTSRASLIESYTSLQNPPQTQVADTNPKDRDTASDRQPQPSRLALPVTKLLPHLPPLTQTSKNERSLVQQSIYLQSQIVAANQEIEEALLRLSAESHLLPPGSKDVAAWGKTASEAEAAMNKAFGEHMQISRQKLGGVNNVVELCSLQAKFLTSTSDK